MRSHELVAHIDDAVGRTLAATAAVADRLLSRWGLTPPRLGLPPGVVAELRAFFGGTIDPEAVVIRTGSVPGVPHPRAFALPGLIYLGADPGLVPGLAPGDRPRATPTLVHELTHIWQGQHVGPRYVPRALREQVVLGRRAYDWRAVAGSPGVRRWPVEAHAQLVSEAYAVRHGFAPANTASGWRDGELRAVDDVLTRLQAGDASTLRGRAV